MTTNGSNRPPQNNAQGSFSDNSDKAPLSGAEDIGDLGELSKSMLSRLSQTIEGDIIPRLMLAFESPQAAQTAASLTLERITGNVDEFARMLIDHDASVATTYVSTLRGEGIPLATLYLNLLAPTARRLGEMWEDDTASFTEVTIGVCRMHQVLLELSRCFDAKTDRSEPGRNALIAPAPGEQHTFGLFMVMEFLRRAGWNCWSGAPMTKRDFLRLAQEQDFDVIGLSISSDQSVDSAAEVIADIRRSQRNGNAVIVAGGRSILEDPGVAARIGADAIAADGREAVQQIDQLCRKASGKTS